ncbi:MAG: lipoate--protein ligase family protein [Thermoleophilia bacterium]
MKTWRLLDTGARTAAENIALDSALLKARSLNRIPNTLHFLSYSPTAVLVGYFQSVAQEVREEFCRDRGLQVQRRITGGGAIYFDESHLGWEIVGSRADFGFRVDDMSRHISQGVIAGLRRLGVNAEFRPRNDIEVGGRKISGTGGVFEDDALLFQGTLLLDLDVENMIKALRIPTEKLTARGLSSISERVTSLREELGFLPEPDEIKAAITAGFSETLGVDFVAGELTGHERELAAGFHEEYQKREWIELMEDPPEEHQVLRSALKVSGGLIRTAVSVDTRRRLLKYALITGDFFIDPRRTVLDLEAALKSTPISSIRGVITDFFEKQQPQMLDLTPADFATAVESAVNKLDLVKYGIDLAEANSVFTVNGSFKEAVDSCSMLLLPYCAKLVDCEFRETDGCDQCGQCGIGDAYAMASELGLDVITIHDYEHLRDTLRSFRDSGVTAYIGCCCEAFFIKHQRTFREVGITAALIDIEKDTCYQLGVQEKAYAGQFENQTDLKLDLLKKVLDNTKRAQVA